MHFSTPMSWNGPEELTIFSKQAEFALGDKKVTLLDTPGHADFSAEMERTLQVLDYAVLVISGADGVQGHTRTLWSCSNVMASRCSCLLIKWTRMERTKSC